MNNDRWAAADRLFDATLERKPHERAAFLGEACAGDEELQRAVESLLEHARDAVGKMLDADLPILLEARKEYAALEVLIGGLTARFW